MLRNHEGESGRFQLFLLWELNMFLEFLLGKSMSLLQWTSLGPNPFPSSELPTSGE